MYEMLRLKPKNRKADWIDRLVMSLSGREVLRLLITGSLKIDDGENLVRIRLLNVFPKEGSIFLHLDGYAPEGRIDAERLYESVGSLSFRLGQLNS